MLKSYTDPYALTVEDLNTSPSSIERLSTEKLNRQLLELSDVINQTDLTHIYKTFCPNTKEYTFFLAFYGTFSKIDQVRGHKANLKKYNKIEITACILSDHHRLS